MEQRPHPFGLVGFERRLERCRIVESVIVAGAVVDLVEDRLKIYSGVVVAVSRVRCSPTPRKGLQGHLEVEVRIRVTTVRAFGGADHLVEINTWEGCVALNDTAEWGRKGATLSNISAQRKFQLTEAEIERAMRDGTLQYRINSMQGNPFFRLLTREVEALAVQLRGEADLRRFQKQAELAQIERDIKRLRREISALEERKVSLVGPA